MNVQIGNKSFKTIKLYDFDDATSIVVKYSLIIPDSIPSYFRIQNPTEISESKKIIIHDVRTEFIHGKTISSIIENLPQILSLYQELSPRIIGFLYIIDRGDEFVYDVYIKQLDSFVFATKSLSIDRTNQYRKSIAEKIVELQTRMVYDEKIGKMIQKQPLFIDETPRVFIDETRMTFKINIQTFPTIPLINIFDMITVSSTVPFIVCMYNSRLYTKVYKHALPEEEWIQNCNTMDKSVNIILMYVFSIPSDQMYTKQIQNKNKYAISTIESRSEILLTIPFINPKKGILKEKEMYDRAFSVFGSLPIQVTDTFQSNIRGHFIIENIVIDRTLFADLIETNILMNDFLFLDEVDITVLKKDRLFVYYSPHQEGNIEESLGLVITSKKIDDTDILKIRITKAHTLLQLTSCVRIFCKLLEVYNEEKVGGSILEIYKVYKPVERKKHLEQKKQDMKTGNSLQMLKRLEPKMFGNEMFYSKTCEPKKQPRIVDDLDHIKKQMKQDGLDEKEIASRILNYSNVYSVQPRNYTCWDNDEFIYPGLKNYHGNPLGHPPFAVCCYKKNRTTKSIQQKKMEQDPSKIVAKPTSGTHVVGPHHQAIEDRRGTLPYNWIKIITLFGVNPKMVGDKMEYAFTRYGVVKSPSSIIHCLERATKNDYLRDSDKINRVNIIRKKIAKDIDQYLPFAQQELFSLSRSSIKKLLLDYTLYIDPKLFVSVLKQYYKVNILLFVIDEAHPDSELQLPNFSQSYLQGPNKYKDTVVIFMYQTTDQNYSYQCELLLEEKDKMYNFKFSGPFIDYIQNIVSQCNSVYIAEFINDKLHFDQYL